MTKQELIDFYIWDSWYNNGHKESQKQAEFVANKYLELHQQRGEVTDYKAKYEKCLDVIKRFDPGIIGMYDL